MKHQKIFIFILTIFILTAAIEATTSDADNIKIRVTVNVANVRLKPGLDSAIIGTVKKGDLFDVVQKAGDWYQIVLPPDAKGDVYSGYLNKIVVEEVSAEEAKEAPRTKTQEQQTKPKTVTPPPPPPPPPAKKATAQTPQLTAVKTAEETETGWNSFYVRLGGGIASKTSAYDNNWTYEQYHENAQINEHYDIKVSGFAFDGGIGFFFIKNLGVEASVSPTSGETTGTISGSFPHPLYFNAPRTAQWANDTLKYSALELSLDLIFRISPVKSMFFYAGGGGTYFMNVQVDNLSALNLEEAYPYDQVTMSPEYASYKASAFGFNVCGGLDYFLMKNIAVNVHARFSSGSADISIPNSGSTVSVKAGGIKALGGIKFVF